VTWCISNKVEIVIRTLFLTLPLSIIYILAWPFIAIWWLITHPMLFAISRIMFMLLGGLILALSLSTGDLGFTAVLGAIYALIITTVFSEKGKNMLRNLHETTPSPPWEKLTHEDPRQAMHHSEQVAQQNQPYLDHSHAPQYEEPVAPEEEIFIAEAAPTVRGARQELPTHLQDLMNEEPGGPFRYK
jgi:hypothetical protein